MTETALVVLVNNLFSDGQSEFITFVVKSVS